MPEPTADRAWIAVLPSWYPHRQLPNYGIFIGDQNAGLAAQGYHVEVFYPAPPPTGWEPPPGVVERRTPQAAHGHLHLVAFQIAQVIARTIARRRLPALLVANSPVPSGLAAAFCSFALGRVPMVMIEHMGWPEGIGKRSHTRAIYALMTRAADVWAAVSEPHQAHCLEVLPIHARRIAIVPNVVSDLFFERTHQRPWRERRGLIFVGNLKDDGKGVSLLLEATAATDRLRSERLVIVGHGALKTTFEARARELGLNQVEFVGGLQRAEVAALLGAARAFVLPTRRESFGLAPLEALAMGCRVICPPIPSLASLPAQVDGLTVLSGRDPHRWACAMENALDAPEGPSTALREALVQRHSPAAFGRQVLELVGLPARGDAPTAT